LKLLVNNDLSEEERFLITDKNKLSSILTNLIKNAIKYTNSGNIDIGCKRMGELIELYVKDTGIGIPAERQVAIFNRFEQADIEDKQVHEGSGLGLAIAKSYVEMLGGKIWVESVENKGSTFYFTISYKPAKTITKKKKVKNDESKDKLKHLNVLIVEDDETSLFYLSTILKNKVQKIEITKNGLEAIEMCKDNSNVDLILMDIKIPGMNGLDATRKIRQFNKKVKIIAQTAHALEGDREKALEAGCDDYISKPINQTILFNLINKHLIAK
jgi:CheY-like chemotaxis protein